MRSCPTLGPSVPRARLLPRRKGRAQGSAGITCSTPLSRRQEDTYSSGLEGKPNTSGGQHSTRQIKPWTRLERQLVTNYLGNSGKRHRSNFAEHSKDGERVPSDTQTPRESVCLEKWWHRFFHLPCVDGMAQAITSERLADEGALPATIATRNANLDRSRSK